MGLPWGLLKTWPLLENTGCGREEEKRPGCMLAKSCLLRENFCERHCSITSETALREGAAACVWHSLCG